jgi:cell division protein FtsA
MKNYSTTDGLLVALDVGTTKICVLIAQKIDHQTINIIGIGKSPSLGVSRGVIVDIALAVKSIKEALYEAEMMAGCKIESVAVGVSGSHIQSLNSQGMIPIKNGRIRTFDVAAVLAAAKAVVIPEGQQILHVIPQYYCIDSQQKIMDPVGMCGVRLEAQVHIITGAVSSIKNLINCCELAGVKVSDVILEPVASAHAVLSNDERELGVGLLDIGGGTSDFAIYHNGSIRHTKIFGIAGNHITHDIALCLRTTLKDAERVKREFGRAYKFPADSQEFKVEMVQGNEHKLMHDTELVSIIEPRVTELLLMLQEEITKNNLYQFLPAGLVLTGGGALLQGIKEIAQNTLLIPVRVGNPHVPVTFKESLESPLYATGYGLLLHMLKNNRGSIDTLSGPLVTRIFWRMKSWISDFF